MRWMFGDFAALCNARLATLRSSRRYAGSCARRRPRSTRS
jgi:hypothetical protein